MLDEGVYLAPSAYEAGFLSIQHSELVISEILRASEIAFANIE
jgi:glutamate-1-semialdehyde 2,1-aminomutase